MKRKLLSALCIVVFILINLKGYELFARSVAIATSGGDENMQIDRWRRGNVDRACRAFAGKGIRECKKVFSKQDFLRELRSIVRDFKCGDTLVLYFIGHGDRDDGFVFDRESSRSANRLLTEDEILDVLKDMVCCAKVYVALHSCFSGRYTEKLAQDPHVAIAVSSSSKRKKSHKKPQGTGVNPLNWPDGFVAGFSRGNNLFDAFQKGARQGQSAAEGTGGNKRRGWDDDPQDFKRGHVEEVTATSNKIKIRLRSDSADVIVYIPSGRASNLSQFRTQHIIPCMDITISDEAAFNDSGHFSPGSPAVAIENISDAEFHVLEVVNRATKKVKVVIVKPERLCCSPREITLDSIPPDMKFCKYYTTKLSTTNGAITNGSDLTDTTGEPYPIKVTGRIVLADSSGGIYVIDMDEPISGRRKIKIKPGETFPPWIKPGNIIEFTGEITDTTIEQSENINAKQETFYGHLDEYDAAAKIMVVTLNNRNREGLRGRTLTVNIEQTLPAGVQPCVNILFRGRLEGDIIEDANTVNRLP